MRVFDGIEEIGRVKCNFYNLHYKFQFIDYIYGGCNLNLIVAMDLSLSNGLPDDPTSFHYMPTDEEEKSQTGRSNRKS